MILDSVEKVRTVSPDGGTTFSGFEIYETLPALQSMLDFPSSASDLDKSLLVWRAISSVSVKLTQDSFLVAINKAFIALTATSLQSYEILTSISLAPDGLPLTGKVCGSAWRLLNADFPHKFIGRQSAIADANIPEDTTSKSYTKVIVSVKAKSSYQAMTKALRAIDIQRGVWCLIGNVRMESFGTEWEPINVVRLGGVHTVHLSNGTPAPSPVWFEPGYVTAQPFRPANVQVFKKNCAFVLRRILASRYSERLCEALLRFVRALDERDQNHALIKLWGALEELTCPDSANYELLTRRCSYCFKDTHYHRQMLEHLREYRNQAVHAGNSGTSAKTHCYQLQYYFFQLFFFHLRNVKVFSSLDEANQFLDLPVDKESLLFRRRIVEKAIRFVS